MVERNDVRFSRKAQELIVKAQGCGVDPVSIIADAVQAVSETGRKKVGPFGPGKKPFERLREAIQVATKPFPW